MKIAKIRLFLKTVINKMVLGTINLQKQLVTPVQKIFNKLWITIYTW